jgi:hypothetical protein
VRWILKHSFLWILLLILGGACSKKPDKPSPAPPAITAEAISNWDRIASDPSNAKFAGVGSTARLRAYLFYWQKAFADAAYFSMDSFKGNLDPISTSMLQMFYPEYEKPSCAIDPLSTQLTASLLHHLENRFIREESRIRPPKLFITENSWKGTTPYDGLEFSSLLPWILTKPSEFRAPAPTTNRFFWLMQYAEMKQIMENTTDEEREKIAHLVQTDWIDVANAYMEKTDVPVAKRLEVRSKLAMALLDSMIAFFDSKYAYLVQRPNMLDPNLKTLIPTPNHPSYPAGDSTVGAAAAIVLSHYFPENRKAWEELAEDCGRCKIRAGLHFPIDHTMGKTLGQQIGRAILTRAAH